MDLINKQCDIWLTCHTVYLSQWWETCLMHMSHDSLKCSCVIRDRSPLYVTHEYIHRSPLYVTHEYIHRSPSYVTHGYIHRSPLYVTHVRHGIGHLHMSHVCHNATICGTRDTFMFVTCTSFVQWLCCWVPMVCHLGHDSFIRVTWLIHMCVMTHLLVRDYKKIQTLQVQHSKCAEERSSSWLEKRKLTKPKYELERFSRNLKKTYKHCKSSFLGGWRSVLVRDLRGIRMRELAAAVWAPSQNAPIYEWHDL